MPKIRLLREAYLTTHPSSLNLDLVVSARPCYEVHKSLVVLRSNIPAHVLTKCSLVVTEVSLRNFVKVLKDTYFAAAKFYFIISLPCRPVSFLDFPMLDVEV